MPSLGLDLAPEAAGSRRRARKPDRRRQVRTAAGSPVSGVTAAGSRFSFGSDLDALFFPLSFSHLEGCEDGGIPDPDWVKGACFPRRDNLTPPLIVGERSPEPQEEDTDKAEEEEEEEDDGCILNPAIHSFSLALRECRNRRVRSEAISSPRRRRPVSIDLNGPTDVDVTVLSPRLLTHGAGGMKGSSAASSNNRSGVFPSPGTPGYKAVMGSAYQKGWSSERVPLPVNGGRRYLGGSALLPFNNGRALPSKWDDAEKWICSPISGDGVGRLSVPPMYHRRPKSKSGPLGPPTGIAGPYSLASPMVPCFDSGRVGTSVAASPSLRGVAMADRGCCGSNSSAGSGGGLDGGRRSSSANAEPCFVRSASLHGWSDALIESSSSLQSSRDEKLDSTRESAISISPVVMKKDVATQMSPEGSTQSSPKGRPFLSSLSTSPIEELGSQLSKLEVRDVQIDDRVSMTSWSKKHIVQGPEKRSANIVEWKKKIVQARGLRGASWEVAETTKSMSKYIREEAKITAWENLQRAKAEAAIRKLEMKLEKKRSSSMDKILDKLRSAQRKAQEMRSTDSASHSHEVTRTTRRVSYFRKSGQISSLSGCFTCRAFFDTGFEQ